MEASGRGHTWQMWPSNTCAPCLTGENSTSASSFLASSPDDDSQSGHTPALTLSSKVEQTDRGKCESGCTVQAGSSPSWLMRSRVFFMCSSQFQSVNQKGDKCRFEMFENRRQDSRLTSMSVLNVCKWFFFKALDAMKGSGRARMKGQRWGDCDTLSCPDGQTLKSVWTLVNLLLSAPRWTGRAPG